MGSKSLALLCESILEDHFSFYVSSVGHVLLKGPSTFRQIHKLLHKECKSIEIKKSLAILDLHNLIDFKMGNRGVVYTIRPDEILRFLRYPRLLQIVERSYGRTEAKIARVLLLKGRLSYDECVDVLMNEHNPERKLLENEIANAFKRLAVEMLVSKSDMIVPSDDLPVFIAHQNPFHFEPPTKNNTTTSKAQKRKLPTETQNDLWQINWSLAEKIVRDENVFDFIKMHPEYQQRHELYWRLLLNLGRKSMLQNISSDPISVAEVATAIKTERGTPVAWNEIDSAFTPLTKMRETFPSYSPIIRRLGDSGGGLFVIDYQAAFAAACYEHVETVIRERLDDRAVRIFRLICHYRNVEEEQLSKMAMLATKEAKEICHLMLENGYIYIRPIAKSNDFAPSRTFYFYTHKLTELISTMLGLCYDSLRNVIRRRLEEVRKNCVLIDVRRKIETIVANINSDETISADDKAAQHTEVQAEEVETMYMTEEDKRNYQRHLFGQRRMCATEAGLEQSLFVFQMCSLFDVTLSLEEAAKKMAKKRRRPAMEI
ncbi:DNA-directed RNA polymerase III subunit RPC3 [Aphelenchoides besseyi]|nr:DNA-directed RNA polymerase III subunit RPC3 [Aphelenchoides besseyi]